MNKQFTLKEFQLKFQTEEDCYTYLTQQKRGKVVAQVLHRNQKDKWNFHIVNEIATIVKIYRVLDRFKI